MLKRFSFYLILLGIIFALVEISSYYVATKFFNPRGLVYNPPRLSKEKYAEYLQNVDYDLGWLASKKQQKFIDESGSRIIPSFPNPSEHQACVSLYGDSYTYSNRTTPKEAWSNQLSILLDCRVSNFGVSGYGTDQAFMRYKRNKLDTAKVVFLNHFVDDIPRNVSQYWGVRFTDSRQAFVFKPRYVLDENKALKKIPTPKFSFQEIEQLQKKPEKFLKHDYFLPDGHYGSMHLKLPYTWLVVKTIFTHAKFKSLFNDEPIHMPFYQENHPSGALELTFTIMKEFKKEAIGRGQRPIVTIIPFSTDFDYFRRTGEWSFQNLVALLEESEIEHINLAAQIENKLQGKEQHYLYAGEGHFNAQGDRLIAEIIHDYLNTYIR